MNRRAHTLRLLADQVEIQGILKSALVAGADEIDRLAKQVDEIRKIEVATFSLKDCDVGMAKIKEVLNNREQS